MADIEKIRAYLRDMQYQVASEKPWSAEYKYDAYHRLAMTLTLLTNMEKQIERLTRRLSLEEAVQFLSDNEPGGGMCEIRDGSVVFFYRDDPRFHYENMSLKEAIYVAEGILRDKEAQ